MHWPKEGTDPLDNKPQRKPATNWRGIFPIVVTPFTPAYELDEISLRRVVRFCLEAGAGGLVGPANAS